MLKIDLTEAEIHDVLDVVGDSADPELLSVRSKLEGALRHLNPAEGVILTAAQLVNCTNCSLATAQKWVDSLNSALPQYDINTRQRVACFMAQIAHESGAFRWVREIWGPTPAQQRYEGRKDLGNTQPGDGRRFMGRGLLQVTGRANYVMFNARAKIRYPDAPDFVANPELLEQPKWAVISACDWWDRNKCNGLADSDQITAISKKVNGGTNGLAERKAYWRKFLAAIPVTS